MAAAVLRETGGGLDGEVVLVDHLLSVVHLVDHLLAFLIFHAAKESSLE